MHSLITIWKNYIETAFELDWSEPRLFDNGDINYLEQINADKEIIEAAHFQNGIENICLAPNKEYRSYSPQWLFKHSLVIGDTGDGNYFLLLDARDANSKVVYFEHDIRKIVVVANSLTEFLLDLTEGYKKPNFQSNEESPVTHIFDKLESEMEGKDEIIPLHHFDENHDYFDFNNSPKGTSINLDYRGKYTKWLNGEETGVLKLGTESDATIKAMKQKNFFFYLFIVLTFLGWFIYLYFLRKIELNPSCDTSNFEKLSVTEAALKSLVFTFLTFIVFAMLIGPLIDLGDRFSQFKNSS